MDYPGLLNLIKLFVQSCLKNIFISEPLQNSASQLCAHDNILLAQYPSFKYYDFYQYDTAD